MYKTTHPLNKYKDRQDWDVAFPAGKHMGFDFLAGTRCRSINEVKALLKKHNAKIEKVYDNKHSGVSVRAVCDTTFAPINHGLAEEVEEIRKQLNENLPDLPRSIMNHVEGNVVFSTFRSYRPAGHLPKEQALKLANNTYHSVRYERTGNRGHIRVNTNLASLKNLINQYKKEIK
jgi:hypothetical protein